VSRVRTPDRACRALVLRISRGVGAFLYIQNQRNFMKRNLFQIIEIYYEKLQFFKNGL
jgi:hypothetical protein